jgi:hypothetical protein
MRIHQLGEDKEKDERKKVIEEEDGAVSHRQLEVNLEEGEESFHALVAQTFSSQLDENVFERRTF